MKDTWQPTTRQEPKIQMGVLRLFPTLVYQIDALELVDPVEKTRKNVVWTKKENDASENKWILKPHKKLASKFESKINFCLETLGYETKMKMTTSWWTRTAPGNVVYRHKHTNCLWSAVFYPYEDTSSIILESTSTKPMIDVLFKCTDPQYIPYGQAEITIRPGTMLIFPSHIYHWTQPNNTDKHRYSLAMNFMPRGNLLHGDSSFNYQ
tara:strand:- start:48 stop:674 length:627 start_codon:yes stop_codon:yes gene_type:complete